MAAINNDWLDALKGEFKKPYYKKLFETNAAAILDGNDVEAMIPEPIVKRRFFNGF